MEPIYDVTFIVGEGRDERTYEGKVDLRAVSGVYDAHSETVVLVHGVPHRIKDPVVTYANFVRMWASFVTGKQH